MAYIKTVWEDLPSEDTPIVSTALNNIEDGLETVTNNVNNGWISLSGAFTYSSADAPTFVMSTPVDLTGTVGLGMRIKLTQTTTKYFIVTAITNNSITMYGGTDYTLTSSAVSNVYYSMLKAPFGFPIESNKWSIKVVNSNQSYRIGDLASWVNTGGINITIPIGFWDLYFVVTPYGEYSGGGMAEVDVTLSTTPSSESDKELTAIGACYTTGSAISMTHSKAKQLSLSSKTTYYMNLKGQTGMSAVGFLNSVASAVIIAKCSYL